MIYIDVVEENFVGDTKAPVLGFIPFLSNIRNCLIISTGKYMNYQNLPKLQFKKSTILIPQHKTWYPGFLWWKSIFQLF